jgi:hypothetical protein
LRNSADEDGKFLTLCDFLTIAPSTSTPKQNKTLIAPSSLPSISNIFPKAIPTTNKKLSTAATKRRKQLHSPSSSSATLTSSSPTINSDNDEPTTKKPKTTKAKTTRAKRPVISTPETEEDINNAKAIAAGRARYAADKLAAQIKEEDDEETPIVDGGAEADAEQEPMGMNLDSGEDEGLTAYELVKNEAFGEGVEI